MGIRHSDTRRIVDSPLPSSKIYFEGGRSSYRRANIQADAGAGHDPRSRSSFYFWIWVPSGLDLGSPFCLLIITHFLMGSAFCKQPASVRAGNALPCSPLILALFLDLSVGVCGLMSCGLMSGERVSSKLINSCMYGRAAAGYSLFESFFFSTHPRPQRTCFRLHRRSRRQRRR
jgi:hypothetical protein